MPHKNKIHVFTDCDLDGAGAYLMLCLATKQKLPYTTLRVVDAAVKIGAWLDNNDLQSYDRVYVADLDISQSPGLIERLDHPNVTVIDHHKQHIDSKDQYNHAETMIRSDTSTTKIVYKMFNLSESLSNEQKLLVLMVDDYDSYKFKVPRSHELNIVFWSYQGDRITKFIDDFGIGFVSFNQQHQNIIQFYNKKLQSIKSNLDVHTTSISIQGKTRKIVAVFADSCINDVADYIIKNYKCDIGMVINLKSNKVSIRRSTSDQTDLNKLAEKLFDQGGGHVDASGGVICEKFLAFSKLFEPMKIKQI